MTLRRETRITREMVRAAPAVLFVFGDNMQERGMGGQAREMRGEPNAVGIPTKWKPECGEDAYFGNGDGNAFWEKALPRFRRLKEHLEAGGEVVWPTNGIGSGLADLPARAPIITSDIERALATLEAIR